MKITFSAHISPELQKCFSLLKNRRRLMDNLGGAAAKTLRTHFRARNAEPNAGGFHKTNWWAGVANATALAEVTDDSATVAIAHNQFPLKLYGGTVRPKTAKLLALPLRDLAYGSRPSEGKIAGLFFIRSRVTGKAYLARREGAKFTLYYRLVPKTTHAPDPRALPDMQQLAADLTARAERHIERELKTKN